MVTERIHTQKATYYMIIHMQSQNRQIHKDRNRLVVARGRGKGRVDYDC